MNVAAAIIQKFGGTRPAAERLGLPPSTVQSWKVAGRIPAQHQMHVLTAAAEGGINLQATDFFSAPVTAA